MEYYSKAVKGADPIEKSPIQHFLDEPVNTGKCGPGYGMDLGCLLPDLTPNPDWKRAPKDGTEKLRVAIFPWMVQENQFALIMAGIDKLLEDESRKRYPPAVTIHGDKNADAP